MTNSEKYGTMVTWTCYECFGEVRDHDNDGVGWCAGCRRVVDANGVPQERFAALRRSLEVLPRADYANVSEQPFQLPDYKLDVLVVKTDEGWNNFAQR